MRNIMIWARCGVFVLMTAAGALAGCGGPLPVEQRNVGSTTQAVCPSDASVCQDQLGRDYAACQATTPTPTTECFQKADCDFYKCICSEVPEACGPVS